MKQYTFLLLIIQFVFSNSIFSNNENINYTFEIENGIKVNIVVSKKDSLSELKLTIINSTNKMLLLANRFFYSEGYDWEYVKDKFIFEKSTKSDYYPSFSNIRNTYNLIVPKDSSILVIEPKTVLLTKTSEITIEYFLVDYVELKSLNLKEMNENKSTFLLKNENPKTEKYRRFFKIELPCLICPKTN